MKYLPNVTILRTKHLFINCVIESEQPFPEETNKLTLYVPEEGYVNVGFCSIEVFPPDPKFHDQLLIVPPFPFELSVKETDCPAHILAVLNPALGGRFQITTIVSLIALQIPLLVEVRMSITLPVVSAEPNI